MVLLLHNHDVSWGLSITLRKANLHHVLYLDSLNNQYPALEKDLKHFWIRTTRAAHSLQLAQTASRESPFSIYNCPHEPTTMTVDSSCSPTNAPPNNGYAHTFQRHAPPWTYALTH